MQLKTRWQEIELVDTTVVISVSLGFFKIIAFCLRKGSTVQGLVPEASLLVSCSISMSIRGSVKFTKSDANFVDSHPWKQF